MGIALGAVLKAAASSVLGKTLSGIAYEKVTTVARDKLGLPPDAPEVDIEAALVKDPATYQEVMASVVEWRMEQERTYQVAIEEQGKSERVALMSDSRFVRWARPTMIYLGGFSCFALIVFGALIVWTAPEKLVDYVQLVEALAMPLTALLTAGGVYAYRRTTDKAISKGMELPSVFGVGEQ